jgi:hypothetical protein
MAKLMEIGVVTAYDTANNAVFVQLQSGGPTVPVQVGTDGPNDQWRTKQEGLPVRGTRVILAFPYGDDNNGVILRTVPASLANAFTTGPTDHPQTRYHAHWSGFVSYQEGDTGEVWQQWPDGTTVGVAPAGNTFPTLYQTVVTSGQVAKKQPISLADRTGQGSGVAISPYAIEVAHPTGASVAISASGGITVAAAPGQTATLTVSGGAATLTVNGDGTITLAASTSVSVTAPTLTATASASVTVQSPNINLGGTGGLYVKRSDDSISTTTKAV